MVAAAPLGAAVAADSGTVAGDPAAGAKVFKKCASCHEIGPGAKTKVGPPLNGIIGQTAGELPGYPFSDAMKNSGIVWSEETLTQYLKSPRKMVPGTKMTFAGLPRANDIANVIAYLKTFDIDGNTVDPAAAQTAPAPAPAK
jgi:cytochrome c